MSERTNPRLALGAWSGMVAFIIAGLAVQVITRHTEVASSFAFRGSEVLLALSMGSVGVLIASRRRDNPIG
jgi:glucan phosphoethanolaminetransferase (alkaline phosphatase superfamily)